MSFGRICSVEDGYFSAASSDADKDLRGSWPSKAIEMTWIRPSRGLNDVLVLVSVVEPLRADLLRGGLQNGGVPAACRGPEL